MAFYLDLEPEVFVDRYTDLNPDRSGLVLKNRENGECCFLEGTNTCLVQKAKPLQCQGFPNTWNFPGWKEACEALPVEEELKGSYDT